MHSIFVSSTFRDMHFERDVLNRSVNSKLNRLLADHNQSVRLMDLRWGVDTSELSEEESTERVLQVCFDEVEHCKPYILILLGDRYGYVPKGSDMSVTHMEILRGALENTDPAHVFVYIRETDPEEIPAQLRPVYMEQQPQARQQLEELKAQLLQRMPERCRFYRARWSREQQLPVSEEFENLVYADLSRDLLQVYSGKKYISPLEKQLAENDEILREHLQYAYCNAPATEAAVQAFLSARQPYGVVGEAGMGKSVFMSLFCAKLRQAGMPAYILFCGDNAFSSGVRNAAEAVLYALTVASSEEYDFAANAQADYGQLLQKLIAQREKVTQKVCFILDAVDKCEAGMVQFLLWCHRFLDKQLCLAFSSQKTEDILREERSFQLMTLSHSRADMQAIAQSLLNKHGKTVNGAILTQLVEKVATPLQLSVLLLRLLHLTADDFAAIEKNGGGINAINGYLQQLIEAAAEEEAELLDDYLATLLDNSANPRFALFLYGLLAFSDRGLQETDLREIMDTTVLGWVQLDYMAFLEDFSFLIRVRENGKLDISHDAIRRGFRQVHCEQAEMFYEVLTRFFFEVEDPRPDQVEGFFRSAYGGKNAQAVAAYILKYYSCLSGLDGPEGRFGLQLRQALARMLMEDNGQFIMRCFTVCQDIEQICKLQTTVTSSVVHYNNYLSDEDIFKIAQLCLAIPEKLEIFPAQVALMELHSCQKFLQRHNCTDADTLEYVEYCRQRIEKRAYNGNAQPQENCDPIEQKLVVLTDPEADLLKRALAFEQLRSMGRKMAGDAETAERARALLLTLEQLNRENALGLTEELVQAGFADIYTSLGVWGKTMKQWEDGLRWDQKSTAIYQRLYEEKPSQQAFRKYRERVYNEANLIEAWAMEEKADPALWERTRQAYGQCYQLEMQAIALGVPERELIQCASTIISYGTALINCGQEKAGLDKYREGIRLIEEMTANNPRVDLHTELIVHQLEGTYQLCMLGRYSAAVEISQTVGQCISYVVEHGNAQDMQLLMAHVNGFVQITNQLQAQLAKTMDVDAILSLYRISDQLYEALLPQNDPIIKQSFMIARRNLGNFLMKKEDYAGAARAYGSLLETVRERDLLAPDENGRYDERASLNLSNVYVHRLCCLSQLEDKVQIKQMLDMANDWAKYICEHCPAMEGDFAKILLVMGMDLTQKGQSVLGQVLWMLAFSASQEEDYDGKKHADTVLMILQALGDGEDG